MPDHNIPEGSETERSPSQGPLRGSRALAPAARPGRGNPPSFNNPERFRPAVNDGVSTQEIR